MRYVHQYNAEFRIIVRLNHDLWNIMTVDVANVSFVVAIPNDSASW